MIDLQTKRYKLETVFIHEGSATLGFKSDIKYEDEGALGKKITMIRTKTIYIEELQELIKKYGNVDETGWNSSDAYLILYKGYNTLYDLIEALTGNTRIPQEEIDKLCNPNGGESINVHI